MIRPLIALSLLLAGACQIAQAAQLIVKIQPSTILPNPNALPPSTHATITSPNGNVQRAPLRKDNTLIFESIPSVGSHRLDIYTRDYTFAAYRIDTSPNLQSSNPADQSSSDAVQISLAAQLYHGVQWSDHGVNLIPSQPDTSAPTGQSTRAQSSLTLVARVLSQKQFYETRPTFSPLSLLKNPMILMGVVALAFTFGMPKLMENMDPEMKQEYEEMQKKGPTAAIGRAMGGQGPATSAGESFDLAGYLAGQKKDAGDVRGKR